MTGFPLPGVLSGTLQFGGRREHRRSEEGTVGPIQQLAAVASRLQADGTLVDLNAAIAGDAVITDSTCFFYRGAFRCLPEEQKAGFTRSYSNYVADEEAASVLPPPGPNHGLTPVGRMCVLESQCDRFAITLACSMKYFSDMGGSRVVVGEEYSDRDLIDIHPHSGNHHFFAGRHLARFDALIILTGQDDTRLFGSPLALINRFSPDLTI